MFKQVILTLICWVGVHAFRLPKKTIGNHVYIYYICIYVYNICIYIYIHIQDAYHIIYYIMLVILIDPIRIYNWNNLKNSCWVATFAQSKHRIRAIYFAIVSMAWCPRYCPDTFSHNSTPLKSPDHLPKVDLSKGCSWMALTWTNQSAWGFPIRSHLKQCCLRGLRFFMK